MTVVDDRGFFITMQAIRRQLAAMPNELYLVRMIHHPTRRAFPGERLWTATLLGSGAAVGFLRACNCQGGDIYVQPYAGDQNAGYILVDLDHASPKVIATMRAQGHDPCVVLQTSPGHLQAWIHLSNSPLEPAVATAAGKHLAHLYGGDLASTDWRHLGRLAGFTNQKPTRRTPRGYPPWVKLLHAHAGLASHAEQLLQSVRQRVQPSQPAAASFPIRSTATEPDPIRAAEATAIYQGCLQRWRILQRFPQPDWSIVDLWVARHLLSQGTPTLRVQAILRLASPQFPRHHGDPQDYLRRTIARAAFPSPGRAVCTAPARASAPPQPPNARSNSTGGR